MKIIIVEDELTAIKRLEGLLQKIDPKVEVLARLYNVKDTVDWIKNHDAPDVGFFDIQLSDDHSFQIFEEIKIGFPVVFVTAFDDYLLKAFELNSIHYLLKPINEDKLRTALEKLSQFQDHFIQRKVGDILSQISIGNTTRQKIIAKKGVDYVPVEISDVSYFFSEHKLCFLKKTTGELYMIDHTLLELEEQLDEKSFFRANRQYLIHINSIVKFRPGDNGKIEIVVTPPTTEKIHVAKERAREFKNWIRRINYR